MGKVQCKRNSSFVFSAYPYLNVTNVFFDFQNILRGNKKSRLFINNLDILRSFLFMFSKFRGYKSSVQNFHEDNSKILRTKIHVIRLYLKGIGYKFLRPKKFNFLLRIELGYSISIYMHIPKSLRLFTKRDKIIILGSDYFNITNFSKRIFKLRPADVYKGKGVRYANTEYTVFKPGKQRLLRFRANFLLKKLNEYNFWENSNKSSAI